jgi:putative peptidoglycan lipid II flippase
MSVRSKLVSATGGMAAITVVSRFSGLLREKVVAALLGAGTVSDAFLTGLRIPNMFRGLLAEGALHAAFIPALAELREGGDEEKPRAFVRAMFSTLLLALPVIVAIGVLAAPLFVHLFAQSFTQEPGKFELTVRLTRLMFPYLGLISLAALAQGVLNANHRFLLPAATPIALNLCIVAGTVTTVEVFHGRGEWMAAGVVAGGLAQFALQWPACRKTGMPLIPGRGALTSPEVRRTLALMLPGVPALGIYQLTLLLSNRFAASVGPGAVTCVYQASRMNELVYGVVIVQLTTAVLPMLSTERARDPQAARDVLGFAIRLLSAVTLPSTVFTVVTAVPIVGALLGGGKYTPQDVRTTASALVVYALGMPFLGLTKVLASASYAWKDTATPVKAAALNLLVFFAVGELATPRWGVPAVAAAASAGQLANAVVLVWLSERAHRLPRAARVLPSVARHLAAAALLGVAVYAAGRLYRPPMSTSIRSLATLGGYAVVAGSVYFVALVALGATEWREAREFLARRRKR